MSPEPLRPAAAKTYGRKNGIFVPEGGVASATLAPTVAEINAASALDVTLIMLADGTFNPSKNTNRAKQNRRFGDTQTFEFIGETSWEGGDFGFAVQPQAAAGSDGKKALEKFTEGTRGIWYQRLDVQRAVTPAAGQFVNAYPIEIGPVQITESGDGESAEAAGMVTLAVVGAPKMGLAILA